MGVNFTALIGHRLSANDIVKLRDRFTNCSLISAAKTELDKCLMSRWLNYEPSGWRWRDEIPALTPKDDWWDAHEMPCLEGAGFSIYIGPRVIEATHIEKLIGFIENGAGLQIAIRRLCHALAHELGSEKAIYLPDSAYEVSEVIEMGYERVSIDEIESRLRTEFGPPALVIQNIRRTNGIEYDLNGYFVDRFADL
jgi:hypothetical protein